ncbi:MAG: hypothetical protein JSU87_06555 [Gemmatimonadota bacterium]|nr:MAG: hypothetical protein JSU87_06555 [Gemmatimonadota bacterium]
MADRSDNRAGPAPFPFAISEGAEESRYLTWIRNHSNYMAVRGLLDYSRAVGVLLRGVVLNFLIFVPYLLGISLAVAAAHFFGVPSLWRIDPPFLLTKLLLGLFAAWILVFLLLTPFFRIARYQTSRATGSDSSVKLRDRYERSFGAFLLAILAAAALESLPVLLTAVHERLYVRGVGWPTLASTFGAAAVVFSMAPKILSVLGKGVTRSLAMAAVGAIGVVVPLSVVLFAAHFLVYGPRVDWTIWALFVSIALPVGIFGALVLGFFLRAWSLKDYGVLLVLLIASLVLSHQLSRADRAVLLRFVDNQAHSDAMAVAMLSQPEDLDIFGQAALAQAYGGGDPGPQLQSLRHFAELSWQFDDLYAFREEEAAEAREGQAPQQPAGAWDSLLVQFVVAGEQAGLREEFDSVVSKLPGPERCEVAPGTCEALRPELQLLAASAATVGELAVAHADGKLPRRLIELDRSRIDTLRRAAEVGRYPLLVQALGRDRYLEDAREALSRWGGWFKRARDGLITAAYSSDISRGIYETEAAQKGRENAFWARFIAIAILAVLVWAFCSLTIDVNLTSIHGLYRDRLASAFLVGEDTKGDVDIERDLDLMDICNYEAGSTAPYHLVNAALNLQGSRVIEIRDRNSDFFIFSKKFIGGKLTGYCRSEHMERVFPQMSLATAMAISAAAASPNMGRATTPAVVAAMTLLNIRLGFWVPNPGRLERWLSRIQGSQEDGKKGPGGFSFEQVFEEELMEIAARRRQLRNGPGPRLATGAQGGVRAEPTVAHGLVGIGYSGGGIRSATVNLGMTQALHRYGIFDHVDYMSTVSGGGYLGSSISTLMRNGTRLPEAETPRRARVRKDGTKGSFGQLFRWRVRPTALVREILGKVDEKSRLVNVSDGGHIENLAGIELLRRRCRYIIIGDGEADQEHHFKGLATLIQTARIDLGIHIEIDVEPLRLDANDLCRAHWAVGRIRYPGESERGYLLYIKSSVTGDEDEVINNYRSQKPSFPHESTADQSFSEGQFEAYRSLGQHIGEQLCQGAEKASGLRAPVMDLHAWFEAVSQIEPRPGDPASTAVV